MTEKPTIVQGVVVGSPYETHNNGASTPPRATARPIQSSSSGYHGEKQPTRCRDIPFALLFYGQVIAIAICAVVYGPAASNQFQIAGVPADASGYMYIALATGVISIVLAGLMLSVMMCIAEVLIKMALIIQVILYLVFAVFGFLSGSIVAGIIGLIFFIIGCCYARAVWSRIPFATVNLVTALTAVRANCSVTIVAYFFALLSVAWYLLWAITFLGIYITTTCDVQQNVCQGRPNAGILFGLFLSYYFTTQVLQNCVHVTVAGTVGTWWFSPESASSCCSSAVCGSTFRTLTTSFGSICFGSLIVAILQAIRQLVYSMRDGDNGILFCIADCILGCLESIVEYFNKWAYIYVGLYGYGYIEAGKNVFTLFKDRGWEAIIADNLVSNVLGLLSLAVGLITGGIGVILVNHTNIIPGLQGNANEVWIAFAFGFIIGLVLTSILMSVVGSGVNTVIVCFAEGPAEFQQNHPELSNRMRATWQGSFPGSI